MTKEIKGQIKKENNPMRDLGEKIESDFKSGKLTLGEYHEMMHRVPHVAANQILEERKRGENQ